MQHLYWVQNWLNSMQMTDSLNSVHFDLEPTEIGSQGPRPLTIGTIALENPAILAPMSGITDAPFRRLAARLGAGLVVSEMVASPSLRDGRRDTWLRLEGQGI